MRGSLESPPIVIRTSRGRATMRLGVLGVLAAALSPAARTVVAGNLIGWLLIAIFGSAILATLWELAFPGRLTIGPEGMEQSDLWRRRRWRWSEARHFRPVSNRFYRFVGFNPGPDGGRSRGGLDGFNQDWELAPPALARLLNQARARWFGP